MSSLRLALKQSLAETGHLAVQDKKKSDDQDRKKKKRIKASRDSHSKGKPKKQKSSNASGISTTATNRTGNIRFDKNQRNGNKSRKRLKTSHVGSNRDFHMGSGRHKSDEGSGMGTSRRSISSFSSSSSDSSNGSDDGDDASTTSGSTSSGSSSDSDTNTAASSSDDSQSSGDDNDNDSTDGDDSQDVREDMDGIFDSERSSGEDSDGGVSNSLRKKQKQKEKLQQNNAANKIQQHWKSSQSKKNSSSDYKPHVKAHAIDGNNSVSDSYSNRSKKRRKGYSGHSSSSSNKAKKQSSASSITKSGAAVTGGSPGKNSQQVTVKDPSPEVLEWIMGMSIGKQRRKILRGIRVKVRFELKTNKRGKDGKPVRKQKWYGGVVTDVATGGKRIRIKYDDGTQEVADFPDKDIVVDAEGNGLHKVCADAFMPQPISVLPMKSPSNLMGLDISMSTSLDDLGTTSQHSNNNNFKEQNVVKQEESMPSNGCQLTTVSEASQQNMVSSTSVDLENKLNFSKLQRMQSPVIEKNHSTHLQREDDISGQSIGSSAAKASAVSESPHSIVPIVAGNLAIVGSASSTSSSDSNGLFDHRVPLATSNETQVSQIERATLSSTKPKLGMSKLRQSKSRSSSPDSSYESASANSNVTGDRKVLNDSLKSKDAKGSHGSKPEAGSLTIRLIAPKSRKSSKALSPLDKQQISLVELSPPLNNPALPPESKSRTKGQGNVEYRSTTEPGSIFSHKNVDEKEEHHPTLRSPSNQGDNAWLGDDEGQGLKRSQSELEATSEAEIENEDRLLVGNVSSRNSLDSSPMVSLSKDKPESARTSQYESDAEREGNTQMQSVKTVHSAFSSYKKQLSNEEEKLYIEKHCSGNNSKFQISPELKTSSKSSSEVIDQNERNTVKESASICSNDYSDEARNIQGKSKAASPGLLLQEEERLLSPQNNVHDSESQRGYDSHFSSSSNNHLRASQATLNAVDTQRDIEKENNQIQADLTEVKSIYDDNPSLSSVDANHIKSTTSPQHDCIDSDTDKINPKYLPARSGRRAAQKAKQRIVANEERVIGDDHPITVKKRRDRVSLKSFSPYDPKNKEEAGDGDEDSDGNSEDGIKENWVNCDRCDKWRLIPRSVNVDDLPEKWYCELNIYDPKRNHCGAPEQTIQEIRREKAKAKDLAAFAASRHLPSGLTSCHSSQTAPKRTTSSQKPSQNVGEDLVASKGVISNFIYEKEENTNANLGGKSKVFASDAGSDRNQVIKNISQLDKNTSERMQSFESKSEYHDLLVKKSSAGQMTEPNSGRGEESSGGDNDEGGSDTTAESSTPTSRSKGSTKRSRRGKDDDKEKKPQKGKKKKETERQEWVQCEKCEKWRRLPPRISAKDLPDVWYCTMNTWDPRSASCAVQEDYKVENENTHRDNTILGNGGPIVPVSSGSNGKLTYRNLIFGTGRRQTRAISERTRAAESLFSSQALDSETESSGPPVVMYANSSAFQYKPGSSVHKILGEDTEKISLFSLMSHSKLWEHLYRGTRPLESLTHNINGIRSKDIPICNGMSGEEYTRSMKAMVYYALDTKLLAGHEVLLECQCREWDDSQWSDLRASCTLDSVSFVLNELVTDGLVETVNTADITGFDNVRYRRKLIDNIKKPSGNCKQVEKNSRCMKISKPWKKGRTQVRNYS